MDDLPVGYQDASADLTETTVALFDGFTATIATWSNGRPHLVLVVDRTSSPPQRGRRSAG